MPMLEDEEMLWAALAQGIWPREAGQRLRMDPERVVRICEGWAADGIYEYGVAADLGWAATPPAGTFHPGLYTATRAYQASLYAERQRLSRVDKAPTRHGQ